MKKLAIILGVAFSATLLLSSCEQCSTCSYTTRFNGVDSTTTYPQECGNKSAIEDYETLVRTESAKNGGTVTCTEE
ncbi:MAG: hypothetical protein V4667_13300 [Bacteroidota bacterium]